MATYLFDFDGTLVDSMDAYGGMMLRILDENGVTYPSNILKIITPLGYNGTADYFIEMGIGRTKDELIATMNEYAKYNYHNVIVAKESVPEVLRELKARGDSLNVLTASPHSVLDACLERNGIYELFDNVWSCDDFNTTKANPEIYRMAAERIGKPVSDILFLDDNYNADKTAASTRMKVCGVYDASSAEYTEDIKRISDHYISDFSELLLL